jgi:predicted lipoprotein with Yx(FWY)xxD motif
MRLAALASVLLAFGATASKAATVQLPAGVSTRSTDEGLALSDARGQPVYRLDLDRYRARSKQASAQLIDGRCADVCDRLWRPLAAPPNFAPDGDWSVAKRPTGLLQLAYKGDPLYTFLGKSLEEAEEQAVVPPYFTGYTAKTSQMREGVPVGTVYWHRALYQPPAPRIEAPSGVQIRWDKSAFFYVSSEGNALQVSKAASACPEAACPGLRPLLAPQAALPVGAWRPMDERDGRRVWSYRDRIVYQAEGATASPDAHLRALEAR